MIHKAPWAFNSSELHAAGIAPPPTPGCKELATLLELQGQAVAEVRTIGCVGARCPPTPHRCTLILALKPSPWTDTTHIGGGPLQVVKARCRNIKVGLASATTVAPRRAAILLHDHSSPLRMEGVWILHQGTLSTATNPTIIGVCTAAAIILTHETGQGIRGCPCEPHDLSIHRPTKVIWVLWPIARR